MAQHDLKTIERKLKMGGSVLPSEVLLVLKETVMRLDTLEEKMNELETTPKTRQRSSKVSD